MTNKPPNTAIGINSTPEVFNSLCSCFNCDSLTCFTQRRDNEGCACGNCRRSQACMFYTNESVVLNDSQSNYLNQDNIPEKQRDDDERLTEEINYDDGRYTDAEASIRAIMSKYLTKASENNSSSEERNDSKKGSHARSMTLSQSRQEINPATARLSAQVMNVPFRDLKESLSYNQAEPYQRALTKYDIYKKIKEAYDACSCKVCECIGTKILSVKNEFCKCKPCECEDCSSYLANNEFPDRRKLCYAKSAKECKGLPRLPTEPGDCDCKPCDCIKCTDSHSKSCDCEPCQCVECRNLSIHQPRTLVVAPVGEDHSRSGCLCSPCDCVQCGHFGVPANMMHEMSTGINRHPQCHCEACVDSSCEPDGTDICKCERQRKVMRKPVERDTHDYDIRRVTLSDSREQQLDKSKIKHDTVTMFAALASTFPKFKNYKHMTPSKSSARHECTCEVCECIVCACKDRVPVLAQRQRQSTRVAYPTNKAATCSCAPCECLVCSSHKEDNTTSVKHNLDCRCDICDCINCKSAQHSNVDDYYQSKSTNRFSSKACKCNQCNCPECRNAITKWHGSVCDCSVDRCRHCSNKYVASNESLYPVKRGERLTPSIYNTKVNNSLETLSKEDSTNYSSKKFSSKLRMREDLSIYHTFSQCDYIDCYLNRKPIKPHSGLLVQNTSKEDTDNINSIYNVKSIRIKNDILKCEAYTQYDETHKSILKISPIDYEASGSYHSEYFSYDSTPKTSDTKENSITPISGRKNQSWESSCNSSGHDNPDYIVSFPKSAEAGVRVAMQLNMDKDLNLERLNTALKKINAYSDNKSDTHMNAIDIKLNAGSKKRTCQKTNVKNHYNPRNKNSDVIENKNDLDVDLAKQLKMGNESIRLRKYFQNITTKSLYPVPKISYEPTQTPYSLGNSLPLIDHTRYEKINKRAKYDSCDFSAKYNKLRENCNHKAIDFPSMDEDYKRVQNTLNEAKAFSFKLLQILEKYDKANRDFVSISQKLKKSHDSLLNRNVTQDVELKKMEKGDGQTGSQNINEPEHLVQEIHSHVEDEQVVKDNQVNVSNITCSDKTVTNHHNKDFFELPKKIKENPVAGNTDKKLIVEPIIQLKDEVIKTGFAQNCSKSKAPTVNSNEDVKTDQKTHTIEENGSSKYSIRNSIAKVDEHNNKKRYRKYSRLLRRTIIVSKKINLKCVVEPKLVRKASVCTEISRTLISRADKEVTSEIDNIFQIEAKEFEEINTIAKRLNVVFGSTEAISASTSADDTEDSINRNCEDSTKIDGKSFTILKKNLSLNTEPCTRNKGVCIFPSLEVEIKEAVHSISLQTCAIRGTHQNMIYENKALVKLQVEVNKLLNMPLLSLDTNMDLPPFVSAKSSPESSFQVKLDVEDEDPMNIKSSQTDHKKKQLVDENISCNRQPYDKDELKKPKFERWTKDASHPFGALFNIHGQSTDAVLNCSCEALKVGSLGVRKVSDHTVLVKWTAPRSTDDVNGYELLVDGRPVQKILSPTRCMAVVTCLPHSDKVLITIRTITLKPTHETGHIPSTTVVYRRRAKCY